MATAAKDPALRQYEGEAGLVQRWLNEIELVEQSNEQQQFERHFERIQKKYKNAMMVANYDPNRAPRVMFNVLWSNTQVLIPALYARMPKVIGDRIFKDHDPIGRFAAELSERATHFNLITQQDKFNYNVRACVLDLLLGGRGQGWLEYRVELEDATDAEGNILVDEDGNAIQRVKPHSERVDFVHLNYQDYLESKARTQYEVRWRVRVQYYTYAELVKEFGEDIASQISLDSNPLKKNKRGQGEEEYDFLKQARVYCVYDEPSKEVLKITKSYSEAPLSKKKDPLKLKDFWCCPLPLLATTTTDSTYPTPDYLIYEGLAEELDYVAKRLSSMTECIRLVGMVASQHNKDVKEMLRLNDGQLAPMQGWANFAEKGGLRGVVDWLPFEKCLEAIPVLQQRFTDLKAQIDEITSMPDIVRGSSDPNDPVYSQQQKSHWTVIKLMRRQQDVQVFCRQIVSKMAEIIFEPGFFSDETIALMAGVPQMAPDRQEMFYPALQLLRDDRMRTFRLDIETDSTLALDENDAMERWFKYLEGLNGIFQNIQGLKQFAPEMLKPALESAIGAIRTLRAGRSVEGAWERALDEIEANEKAMKENPPPPQKDPMMLKAEADMQRVQIEGQKAMAADALEQRKQGFNEWLEQQRLQLDSYKIEGELETKTQANQIAAGKEMSRAEIDKIVADMDSFQAQLKAALETEKLGIEKERLSFDKEAKALEMQEKLMEERRLDSQDALEVAKLQQQERKMQTQERIARTKSGAKARAQN